MNRSLVAPIQTRARTRASNRAARWANVSHLSDPPTIRRRFFVSPYDESAASRLWELVDFESSTNTMPCFSQIFSRRCGSQYISERYRFVRLEHILISFATRVLARIFIALCTPENDVSERLYFFRPEMMILSPSVISL